LGPGKLALDSTGAGTTKRMRMRMRRDGNKERPKGDEMTTRMM